MSRAILGRATRVSLAIFTICGPLTTLAPLANAQAPGPTGTSELSNGICFDDLYEQRADGSYVDKNGIARDLLGKPTVLKFKRVCLPIGNVMKNSDVYTVSDISLALSGDQLGECRPTSAIVSTSPGAISKQVDLMCQKDQTIFEANVNWTDEQLFIRSANIYICGPQMLVPGGDFEATILQRYGKPVGDTPNRLTFNKDTHALNIARGGPNTALAKKTCDANGDTWRFRIQAHARGRGTPLSGVPQVFVTTAPSPQEMLFIQHVQQKVMAQQNKAPIEKF